MTTAFMTLAIMLASSMSTYTE